MDKLNSSNITHGEDQGMGGAWIFLLLLLICTILANAFVFLVILKSDLLNYRQNVFIIFLVICDFCRSFFMFLQVAIVLDRGPSSNCSALGFFVSWSNVIGCCAVNILLYDRLIFMSGPINYIHRMSKKVMVMIIMYTNFHGFVLAVLPVGGWGSYSYVNKVVACDVQMPQSIGYSVFGLFWGYLIPIIGGIVIFVRICMVVLVKVNQVKVYGKLNKTLQPMGIHKCIGKNGITEADMAFVKTLRILATILGVYYFSWLSHICLMIYLMARNGQRLSLAAYVILRTFSYSTCFINPFLYGMYNRHFRATVKKVLTCGRIAESDIEDIRTYPPRSISLLALKGYQLEGMGRYTKNVPSGDEGMTVGTEQVQIAVRGAWNPEEEEYVV